MKAALNQQNRTSMKPIISILIIIASLFTMVFLQMEVRRQGYIVWKQSRLYKAAMDDKRVLVSKYANITNSNRLQEVAFSKLTLTEAKSGQIIHMSGDYIALKQ